MDIILNTFGTSISCENDGFIVNHKDGKQRIPVNGVNTIQISKGAQITSDAVLLAIEKEIEVLFMNRSGDPQGRIWSNKYGSVSSIRKGQLTFTFSQDAIEWIKGVIKKKIENQQALLLTMEVRNELMQQKVNKAMNRLEDYRTKIDSITGEVISDIAPTLRGWEGVSSRIYFEIINEFLPEQYRFVGRSQHPARDVVNALLNYGYGILYAKIEGALIKSGIDPYVGVMHRDDYNRPVMVYDVIELYRVWVDYVVLSLVLQHIITDEFFLVKEDGSYWLEGLGKRILIQSLNDYLEELIVIKGISRSRYTHMSLYCQELAQKFKKYN